MGVTIQIPYEIEPGCDFTNPVCNVVLPANLVVTVNGATADPVHFGTASRKGLAGVPT